MPALDASGAPDDATPMLRVLVVAWTRSGPRMTLDLCSRDLGVQTGEHYGHTLDLNPQHTPPERK